MGIELYRSPCRLLLRRYLMFLLHSVNAVNYTDVQVPKNVGCPWREPELQGSASGPASESEPHTWAARSHPSPSFPLMSASRDELGSNPLSFFFCWFSLLLFHVPDFHLSLHCRPAPLPPIASSSLTHGDAPLAIYSLEIYSLFYCPRVPWRLQCASLPFNNPILMGIFSPLPAHTAPETPPSPQHSDGCVV